ncbi:hypothetical protein [Moraxella lacunata]
MLKIYTIKWSDKNLSDRKFIAFVFSLKNVRPFSFLLQISKAGTLY